MSTIVRRGVCGSELGKVDHLWVHFHVINWCAQVVKINYFVYLATILPWLTCVRTSSELALFCHGYHRASDV